MVSFAASDPAVNVLDARSLPAPFGPLGIAGVLFVETGVVAVPRTPLLLEWRGARRRRDDIPGAAAGTGARRRVGPPPNAARSRDHGPGAGMGGRA